MIPDFQFRLKILAKNDFSPDKKKRRDFFRIPSSWRRSTPPFFRASSPRFPHLCVFSVDKDWDNWDGWDFWDRFHAPLPHRTPKNRDKGDIPIHTLSDADVYATLKEIPCSCEQAREVVDFVDWRGNNILWYLTYRDDQNAWDDFACPYIERELLRLGAAPNHSNNIGLCWNAVRRHVIRAR